MQEPDWDELSERLSRLSVKQLHVVTSRWFAGSMGGASKKSDIVQTMVSQMRHWYRLENGYGMVRVENVFNTISKLDGGWSPEREYAYYTIEYGRGDSDA